MSLPDAKSHRLRWFSSNETIDLSLHNVAFGSAKRSLRCRDLRPFFVFDLIIVSIQRVNHQLEQRSKRHPLDEISFLAIMLIAPLMTVLAFVPDHNTAHAVASAICDLHRLFPHLNGYIVCSNGEEKTRIEWAVKSRLYASLSATITIVEDEMSFILAFIITSYTTWRMQSINVIRKRLDDDRSSTKRRN